MIVMTRRDWRGMEHIPADRAGDHRGQPHEPRRPVRPGALHLRRRAVAGLPGQGERLQDSRCSAAGCTRWNRRRSTGAPSTRSKALDAAVAALERRQVRPHLPGGHHHQGARPVADARQDRRRPALAGHRRAGRSRSRCGGRSGCSTRGPSRLRPVPRTPVTVIAGPPLDLSKWAGAPRRPRRPCRRSPSTSCWRCVTCWPRSGAAPRHRCGQPGGTGRAAESAGSED